MKIGILMTGHPPDMLMYAGKYDQYFARLLAGHEFSFEGWAVVDNEFPSSVEEADGWLISGSKHGAYENHDWMARLEDFIRAADAANRPMIGVCFGHQIIAQAMGGRVEKFEGGWAIGPTEYEMDGKRIVINAWHQDQVVEKPDTAIVTAQNDFCACAALTYGDHIWTLQAHPEYNSDFIDGLITHRGRGVIDDAILDKAHADLHRPLDNHAIGQQMAEFFKRERS